MAKTKEITICNYDVIFNKTHKPSAIYKYFQQIATEDLDTFGLDSKALLDKGMAFVLARMKTVFHKPLFCYEKLNLSSCHRRTKGVSFIRDYILSRDGEVVSETSSYWVLIDIATRRICRPSVLPLENAPNELCSFEIDDRFTFPENVETSFFDYTVVFGDIDENNHMNNTRYPDICLDAINGLEENEFASEIRIDYLNEARISEELSLEYTNTPVNGKYYFRAENKTSGTKCFDMELKINKI